MCGVMSYVKSENIISGIPPGTVVVTDRSFNGLLEESYEKANDLVRKFSLSLLTPFHYLVRKS